MKFNIDHIFAHHVPTKEDIVAYTTMRAAAMEVARAIENPKATPLFIKAKFTAFISAIKAHTKPGMLQEQALIRFAGAERSANDYIKNNHPRKLLTVMMKLSDTLMAANRCRALGGELIGPV